MMKHVLIVFAALLGTGGVAEARGIDCVKAATRLEKTICADPEMRDYDGRIAAAYERALAMWDGAIASYVQLDQRQWLTAFQAMERLEAAVEEDCVLTDRACVLAELRRRADDLESGAYVHSGIYRAANGMKLLLRPGRANGFRVRIYDPADAGKVNITTVEQDRAARWDGPLSMLSVMGDANGLPLPNDDGCDVRLLPEPLVIRVSQTGSCQGHNFEGWYNRLLGETLRSYELELN